MHEMSICENLLQQVDLHGQKRQQMHAAYIHISIGPLSGVESSLLERAFSVCKMGTTAHHAKLIVSVSHVEVYCCDCRMTSVVKPNKLICPQCANWKTQLVKGDELSLDKIEFRPAHEVNERADEEINNV